MAVQTRLRPQLWRAAAAPADRATDREPGRRQDPPPGSETGACGFRRCRRWRAGIRIARTGDSLMAAQWKIGDKIQNQWEINKIFGGDGKSGMGIVYVVYDHKFGDVFAA